MRKLYLAIAGATALLAAGACTDKGAPTTPIGRGLSPSGASFTVSGASFTSTNIAVDGSGVCLNGQQGSNANNCNIYTDTAFVWIQGGPVSSALSDGTYFFAVLVPGGQSNDVNDYQGPKNLSDDVDAYTNRTFTVSGGVITSATGHDFSNGRIRLAPYAHTTNPGGEYDVAVCQYDPGVAPGSPAPGVDPRTCKYDNFKVRSGVCTVSCVTDPFATIAADKFYDANANGVLDAGDTPLARWPMTLNQLLPAADATKLTPASWPLLDPGTYSITEGVPTGAGQSAGWFITYTGTDGSSGTNGLTNSIRLSVAGSTDLTITGVTVLAGGSESRIFGNVCLAGGNGKTRGFWSNTNGASVLSHVANSLTFTEFQLPNNSGALPTGASWTLELSGYKTTKFNTVAAFQTWIGSANAGSNLSYQLGAQAAAMYLNIHVGSPASGGWPGTLLKVDPNSLIYAPGTPHANAFGFATVGAVMSDTKDFLKLYFNVPTGSLNSANRTLGSALIAALDGGNSNTSFVQSTPCAATF
jgi:hypothetical protein